MEMKIGDKIATREGYGHALVELGATHDFVVLDADLAEAHARRGARALAAKGYTFDAEHFWSFYTAKGWRVGSTVMKSWHAACTTWQKNCDQREKCEAIRQAHYDAKMDEREAIRQAHIDARFDKRDAAREAKQNAAASASSNSRYHNGRLKLSNHVDISEEERNDLLKDFFA